MHRGRDLELLQITREKSRKTEAVFLVGSRGPGGGGGIEIPPGLVFFCQRFLLEKQKKMLCRSRKFVEGLQPGSRLLQ